MGDDGAYGMKVVHALLARYGLTERWCFVDLHEQYHGLSRREVEAVFERAELFLDVGNHGAWSAEAAKAGLRVLVDGEPGYSQIQAVRRQAAGEVLPEYDCYYSNGANIGTSRSTSPTAGLAWRPLYSPVVVDLFEPVPPPEDAPFTTVMNWQSHDAIEFKGAVYGQKDVEFEKFLDLPRRTAVRLEVAVAGKRAPLGRLKESGWRVRNGHEVTTSIDAYADYLRDSLGEFSVCKNVFVAMNTGWFSDRSAAYLASGRPVVLQETGFSDHLPCGRGLFAVRSAGEAAAALEEIRGNYGRHAKWARELAREYLDARVSLGRLLREIGI
jgi:hypothetical protein